METKKTKTKRPITRAEAERIKTKYYSLKIMLNIIANDEKYNDRSRQLAKRAVKGLEKWRGDVLDIPKMSNYSAS